MGGGSGGFSTSINMGELAEAANRRIREAISGKSSIAFVTSTDDVEGLSRRIQKSSAFDDIDVCVLTEQNTNWKTEINKNSIVVFYSSNGTMFDFIDETVRYAVSIRKSSLFCRGLETVPTPPYVTQMRVRIVSWTELIDIITKK